MKIQILSDLHIEFEKYTFKINDDIDILVLAGDIIPIKSAETILKDITKNNPRLKIIYVLGNHEFYHETLDNTSLIASLINIPNVCILDNRSIEIYNIIFIGTTLWSDIDPNISKYMNDYRMIYNNQGLIEPQDIIDLYKRNKEFIIEEFEKYKNNKIVLITHHLPTLKSINVKYEDSVLNSAFATDLDDILTKYSPILCIHGHTHSSIDYMLNNTRVVCNPKGYYNENKRFVDQYVVGI